jgi:mRNA interferase RelE/StbE
MVSFEIILRNSAKKDLRNFDKQDRIRILKAITKLAHDPFPPHYRKLVDSDDDYRIRVGDYRVVYEVAVAERKDTIGYVRHRSQAYRQH